MKLKIGSVVLAVILVLSAMFVSGCENQGTVTIKDKDGNTITSLTSFDVSNESTSIKPYIEKVLEDAVELIAAKDNISTEKAQKKLYKKDVVINTAFDKKAFDSIEMALENSYASYTHFACVITDLEGNVCALYSSTPKEYINYATAKLSAHSAFKPLSVYSQAIDRDIINWSSMYEDSPYKTIRGADGNPTDWPQNASFFYSYRDTGIKQAVKESLNTVAVKCLSDAGVTESIEFMMDNFGFSLEKELEVAKTKGDDEVIGNIALGSLYTGVSPLEMAGAYEIFASGGIYNKPCTVINICDGENSVLYEREKNPGKVINEDTAYIMNKLLAQVTEFGGTGADAYMGEGVTAGKTGTGEQNEGNWFVGVIPGYSCAVWHGGGLDINYSPGLFRDIIKPFVDNGKAYPVAENVKEAVYCTESGMLKGKNCTDVDTGYFKSEKMPEICDIH